LCSGRDSLRGLLPGEYWDNRRRAILQVLHAVSTAIRARLGCSSSCRACKEICSERLANKFAATSAKSPCGDWDNRRRAILQVLHAGTIGAERFCKCYTRFQPPCDHPREYFCSRRVHCQEKSNARVVRPVHARARLGCSKNQTQEWFVRFTQGPGWDAPAVAEPARRHAQSAEGTRCDDHHRDGRRRGSDRRRHRRAAGAVAHHRAGGGGPRRRGNVARRKCCKTWSSPPSTRGWSGWTRPRLSGCPLSPTGWASPACSRCG